MFCLIYFYRKSNWKKKEKKECVIRSNLSDSFWETVERWERNLDFKKKHATRRCRCGVLKLNQTYVVFSTAEVHQLQLHITPYHNHQWHPWSAHSLFLGTRDFRAEESLRISRSSNKAGLILIKMISAWSLLRFLLFWVTNSNLVLDPGWSTIFALHCFSLAAQFFHSQL